MVPYFSLQIPPQFDVYDPSKAVNQQKSSHPNHQRIFEDSLDVFDPFCKGLSRPVVDIKR